VLNTTRRIRRLHLRPTRRVNALFGNPCALCFFGGCFFFHKKTVATGLPTRITRAAHAPRAKRKPFNKWSARRYITCSSMALLHMSMAAAMAPHPGLMCPAPRHPQKHASYLNASCSSASRRRPGRRGPLAARAGLSGSGGPGSGQELVEKATAVGAVQIESSCDP
jgi:hypothetical protein